MITNEQELYPTLELHYFRKKKRKKDMQNIYKITKACSQIWLLLGPKLFKHCNFMHLCRNDKTQLVRGCQNSGFLYLMKRLPDPAVRFSEKNLHISTSRQEWIGWEQKVVLGILIFLNISSTFLKHLWDTSWIFSEYISLPFSKSGLRTEPKSSKKLSQRTIFLKYFLI